MRWLEPGRRPELSHDPHRRDAPVAEGPTGGLERRKIYLRGGIYTKLISLPEGDPWHRVRGLFTFAERARDGASVRKAPRGGPFLLGQPSSCGAETRERAREHIPLARGAVSHPACLAPVRTKHLASRCPGVNQLATLRAFGHGADRVV